MRAVCLKDELEFKFYLSRGQSVNFVPFIVRTKF